jgi:hypothetical protein
LGDMGYNELLQKVRDMGTFGDKKQFQFRSWLLLKWILDKVLILLTTERFRRKRALLCIIEGKLLNEVIGCHLRIIIWGGEFNCLLIYWRISRNQCFNLLSKIK